MALHHASNIDYYLEEWNDFISKKDRKDSNETVKLIDTELNKIKKLGN